MDRVPPLPGDGFHGRGVVTCAGGSRYFPPAWVCLNMLRHAGCAMPVELWHLGPREMTPDMISLLAPLGVACVDACEVRRARPVRSLHGWSLKPYSILHSRFEEVLFLDADNVPVLDPTFLFDCPEYRRTGAIFWPDRGRLSADRRAWRVFGVPYGDEPEVESGQIVVDKRRCWQALQLTMHYNEHSDYYYRHVHGDKETFHMAWRRLGLPYAMPSYPLDDLSGKVMVQKDFIGRALFQHRSSAKWQLPVERNPRIPGFRYEEECLKFLNELSAKWLGGSTASASAAPRHQRHASR